MISLKEACGPFTDKEASLISARYEIDDNTFIAHHHMFISHEFNSPYEKES
jgi:hypothetical protein